MMRSLRKHMKKIMWAIAAMFIGGIFFWYGSGSRVMDTVAYVNKSKIELKEYHKRVTQQLRRERERQEKELSDEHIFQIRRQILSSMITQEVLYQESKRLGIVVIEEEVVNTIHNLPQFQQDGKFNFSLYIQTLRYSVGATADEFEIFIRKSIANRKLERLILSSAKVTKPELRIQYLDKYGNLDGFDEKKEEFKNDILQNKRTAFYRNWLNDLQQNTKIKVNAELAGLIK